MKTVGCPRCLAPSCDLCRWCHKVMRLSRRPYCGGCTEKLVGAYGRIAGERNPQPWQRGGQLTLIG